MEVVDAAVARWLVGQFQDANRHVLQAGQKLHRAHAANEDGQLQSHDYVFTAPISQTHRAGIGELIL